MSRLTLAFETSCDETSVAIVDHSGTILSLKTASQIKTHTRYGGVVPEVASRLHAETIHDCLSQAFLEANTSIEHIDQLAVTIGPGLEGCLLVGISVAKTLAYTHQIPLIPVNHILGHIFAATHGNRTLSYPSMALVVSGGHTDLILMKEQGRFQCCGKTRDDAAGEAFDKVARYLGLGYPGGPIIEKMAHNGNPTAFKFPIPMKHVPFEFSFSGLKTAVIDTVDSLDNPTDHCADICASFQQAVIDTLIYKTLEACTHHACNTLIVGGGVAANRTFTSQLYTATANQNITMYSIEPYLCTDNAAMIALAAQALSPSPSSSLASITANPKLRYER